jgi:hypothetical protein
MGAQVTGLRKAVQGADYPADVIKTAQGALGDD